MERKLVKQGNNALTVTLPREWIVEKGLNAGDTVQFELLNDHLSISTPKKVQTKEIILDVSSHNEKFIWHILQSQYIRGFDRMIITHKNPSLIQRICETSFTGFVLESHTENKSILQSIVSTPQDSIDAILKRIYYMFIELADKLTLVQEKKVSSDEVKAYGWLLDKNIFYCMRYLTKYEQLSKNYRYFLLLATLEEAGDILTLLATQKLKREFCESITKTTRAYIHALIHSDFTEAFDTLRSAKFAVAEKTFVDGLARSYFECLYNFSGYLVE